jgi:hypothetical protein
LCFNCVQDSGAILATLKIETPNFCRRLTSSNRRMPGTFGTSAIGQFTAQVNSIDFAKVDIDIDANPDSNGNRQAEYFAANNGSTTATTPGSMPYGTHTIYARAVDYMSMMNGGTPGGWQPFQITVAQPPSVSVSFAASSQNTNSEGEYRSVAIQLSGPAASPVGVGISVVGGTASYGADFTLNNQSVYFAGCNRRSAG